MAKFWAGGFLPILLLAQGKTGDLILISETGEPFRLYMGGEWISEGPVTRAEVHDLPEGPQRATIYIHPTEGKVIQLRRTFYVEGGMIEYYALRKRKGQYTTILYNRAPKAETPPPAPPQPLPSSTPSGTSSGQPPSPSQNTTIIFNPTIQVQTGSGTQVNTSAPPSAPASPTTPQIGNSSYVGPCNCFIPMSRESFTQALQTLRQEPFDQTRLEIAKTIARQNCLLAQDVRSMIQMLEFEDSRLELAKFAYDYVHDLSNYFTVAEALTFANSREELMRYIRSRPARQQCGLASSGLTTPSPGRPCGPCMSPQSFSQVIPTLSSIASETARLETAKQIASTNCLSSEQVREICRTLSSETSRLAFAKYAYSRSCDPQNYFIVTQAFSSTASQQELMQYIQGVSGR
ncbi:MAG: DUF4476 domain-containing protein [Bacteroidia bacterium]|nr:DUF4476 domain-containing protein [Bacteroidia bacterium]MCX7764295.1 DUF4476 domain-containing protein [Bacteroidia bacterium]MDW8057463.1 DUF4476 domain-containing protein [Bacteroidia bacterium]